MPLVKSAAPPCSTAFRAAADGLQKAPVVRTESAGGRPADRLKQEMVSTVAHELKSPLSSILMALDLMRKSVVGPLNANQSRLLDGAREDVGRVVAIIEGLLDLSRFEEGASRLDLQPAPTRGLLEGAIRRSAARAEREGIALEADPEEGLPDVLADPLRIGLVLDNLIGNALRHTGRGGTVRVSARSAGGAVRLAVEDTGEGIAAEHLPNLFERFYRVPGARHRGSTGLGLAIVREIVAAHGGRVGVVSEPGRGSTFSFSLPAARGAFASSDRGDSSRRSRRHRESGRAS